MRFRLIEEMPSATKDAKEIINVVQETRKPFIADLFILQMNIKD